MSRQMLLPGLCVSVATLMAAVRRYLHTPRRTEMQASTLLLLNVEIAFLALQHRRDGSIHLHTVSSRSGVPFTRAFWTLGYWKAGAV